MRGAMCIKSGSVRARKDERWHSDGVIYPKPTWLGGELLARLARWSAESKQSGFKSTLSLISIIKYSKMYQVLKEKYKGMVKVTGEMFMIPLCR